MTAKKTDRIGLEDIPKENPFRVPAGYFEDFTSRLNQRKAEENPAPLRLRGMRRRAIRSHLALAATILVLLAFSFATIRFLINKNDWSHKGKFTYAQAVEDDIENYDLDQLTEIYGTNLNLEQEPESKSDSLSYTEAVITYLMNEDVDLSLLVDDF